MLVRLNFSFQNSKLSQLGGVTVCVEHSGSQLRVSGCVFWFTLMIIIKRPYVLWAIQGNEISGVVSFQGSEF